MNRSASDRRKLCKLMATTGVATLSLPLIGSSLAHAATDTAEAKTALEVMFARRSHRAFTGAKVPDEDIKIMLEAAMNAPSAHNAQPWDFIIVRDDKVKRQITNFIPALSFINAASALIIACTDKSKATDDLVMMHVSVAMACQNLWLACAELGYGTTWLTISPIAARINFFRKLLNVPETHEPFCLMPIGVPQAAIEPEFRYTDTKVHTEKW